MTEKEHNHGDFAAGQEETDEAHHTGSFAEGEEDEKDFPEDEKHGDFAEGQEAERPRAPRGILRRRARGGRRSRERRKAAVRYSR